MCPTGRRSFSHAAKPAAFCGWAGCCEHTHPRCVRVILAHPPRVRERFVPAGPRFRAGGSKFEIHRRQPITAAKAYFLLGPIAGCRVRALQKNPNENYGAGKLVRVECFDAHQKRQKILRAPGH